MLGKFFKYILWILLLSVIGFLFVGLTKYRFDVSGYISYLNSIDFSQVWQQKNFTLLWGTDNAISIGSGAEISGFVNTGMIDLSGAIDVQSGLNVYDPSFEADFNASMSGDSTLTGEVKNTDSGAYGFISPDANLSQTGAVTGEDSRKELLDLIKNTTK